MRSRITCTIEKCVYGGDGLARVDGQVVFIPGTLPGETVEAQVVQAKRSFLRAKVLRVLAPSPDRIPPCCRLADGSPVPGCVYDHVAYPAECRIKQGQLEEMLRRLPAGEGCRFEPPAAAESPLHYRNKITLHAAREQGRSLPILGYQREQSHRVVDLPACPLASEAINRALAEFRTSESFRRITPRDTIVFRSTAADGAGWWSQTIRGRTLPDTLTEMTPMGPLKVPYDGFFQVNPVMAGHLVNTLTAWFGKEAEAYPEIVDTYCGVGGLGLACMRRGGTRLFGVESGRRAVEAARANAADWGVPATFRCVILGRESFALSACVGETAKTTLLADPPRGGLPPEIAAAFRDSRIPRIFYISCDPATLARDLRILSERYRIVRARLVDLFPRTARFETVVELKREGKYNDKL
ncbi:MAG: class I SAM-dependent RNA methyltransferase [Kiritimatiellae bacterium]|nr:class I SAM-dependent RNA methyltransferase [Kiritimatiellia bacterium]